jgi:hypothetical protein
MPSRNVAKKRATWRRWYYRNKKTHLRRVRACDAKARIIVKKFLEEERAKGCTRCPEKHPATIDFHHVSGTKEASIGQMHVLKWSLKRVAAEVAKCIRLCANCHRKHHYEERTAKECVPGAGIRPAGRYE